MDTNEKMAKMPLEITKRDIDILRMVNKYGLIKKNLLVKCFSDINVNYVNSYLAKRLRRLEVNKYLKTYGQSYGLGKIGKSELRMYGVKIEYSDKYITNKMKNIYKISEVIIRLNFKYKQSRIEFINSELKKGNEVSNYRTFAGVVWNRDNKKYLVYLVDKCPENLFGLIKADVLNSGIDNVLIVTNKLEEILKFDDKIFSIGGSNFKVIPNNQMGYELIRLYEENLLNNINLKKYLDIRLKDSFNKIQVINNYIIINNVLISNLLIFDIYQMQCDITYCEFNGYEAMCFLIEKNNCYYFTNLKRNNNFKFNTNNIIINLDMYKEVLQIE